MMEQPGPTSVSQAEKTTVQTAAAVELPMSVKAAARYLGFLPNGVSLG